MITVGAHSPTSQAAGTPLCLRWGFTPGVNAAAANYCLTDTQANWTTQCLRCNTWSYDSTLRVCTTQNCTGTNCA